MSIFNSPRLRQFGSNLATGTRNFLSVFTGGPNHPNAPSTIANFIYFLGLLTFWGMMYYNVNDQSDCIDCVGMRGWDFAMLVAWTTILSYLAFKFLSTALIWLSGAEVAKVEELGEESKYQALGASMLIPATLGFFSMGVAGEMLFDASGTCLTAISLAWSAIVLTIDRTLVKSMVRNTSGKFPWWTIVVRLAIALLLGWIVSIPLEIRIFQKEIKEELMTTLQETKDEVNLRRRAEIAPIQAKIDGFEADFNAGANTLQKEISEGQGGRGDGDGNAAKALRADLESRRAVLDTATLPPLRNQIAEINKKADEKIANATIGQSNGLAASYEALDRAGEKHPMIGLLSILILLFLVTIEILPVVIKMLTKPGKYDAYLTAEAIAAEELVAEERIKQVAVEVRLIEAERNVIVANEVTSAFQRELRQPNSPVVGALMRNYVQTQFNITLPDPTATSVI